jgi:two-component system cell cycle response regulator
MTTMESQPDRRGSTRVEMPTVLVVDDSIAIRRILGRALEAAGYRVTEAADGQQALDACRSDRPDLVLLDVDMPVMDGLTALRAMKDDADLRTLPVLFLTARTGGKDVAVGLELGANDYLRKPCDPDELCARVSTALRVKAQEDHLQQEARALDELSTTDALTGLGNRRRLETYLTEITTRRGGDSQVGVLMIDVDHFKLVNDEHGHAVGDVVLRIVAGRLGGAVAAIHTLARWGGEEFVVLVLDASEAEIGSVGEQLRSAIGGSPFVIDDHRTLAVTVSVGCATGRLGDFDAVLNAADGALYVAKREGRNRVVMS